MAGAREHDVVERFWRAFAARDFDAAVDCLGDDFLQRWPQSGEVIRGPANWRAMATHHPTLPHAEIVSIVGEGTLWVVELVFDYHDGSPPYRVGAIHRVGDGAIRETVEYFGAPFEPAEWRRAWVERAPA